MIKLEQFPRKRLFTHHFVSPLTSLMTPVKELDGRYKYRLKRALIVGILFQLFFFQFFPKKFIDDSEFIEIQPIDIIIENVPQTEQLTKAPPPPRPSVPIPTEDPEVPEDLTIAATDLNFDEIPPPPPPPSQTEDKAYTFIAYETPPEPIGGYSSVLKYITYPELARRAGMECTVIVGVLIDKEGNSIKTQILKDAGGKLGFEEAAQKAVMQVKWIPARQRDKPIEVWISVPVAFKLSKSPR